MPKPYLANPAGCRKVLDRYGFSFRKKFGQNFLIREQVLEDIISTAGIGKDDFVLEIGPGIGTLTQYLAESAGRVCAVEIDRALLPILEDTLSDWDNVTVLNADILKTDIQEIADRENEGRRQSSLLHHNADPNGTLRGGSSIFRPYCHGPEGSCRAYGNGAGKQELRSAFPRSQLLHGAGDIFSRWPGMFYAKAQGRQRCRTYGKTRRSAGLGER